MGVAVALMNLGVVADSEGDPTHAEELLRESVAVFRALGAKVGLASALGSLASVVADQGDIAASAGAPRRGRADRSRSRCAVRGGHGLHLPGGDLS